MNPYAPARRNKLLLGTFALLIAVFLWGLQYKISLYYSDDPGHSSMPPAKLLSEAQRSSPARATISFILNERLIVAGLFVAPSVHNARAVPDEGYALFESQQTSPPRPRVWRRSLPRPPPRM